MKGIADWPAVRLYPIVDHVADKICAMIERHGTHGTGSSRYRDLVDLVLIVCEEEIDGAQLHGVLRTEVLRRRNRGIQIELPEAFQVPDPVTWEPGYAKQAAKVPHLDEFRALVPAAEFAATFVDPLLRSRPPGTWSPTRRSWA